MESARQKIPLCFPCYLFFASLAISTPGFKKKNLAKPVIYQKGQYTDFCVFIYADTTEACMHIYIYPIYVYLSVFGIACKISCILPLSVRCFVPVYVPFANIPVLLGFLAVAFLWAYGRGYLYIHCTKTP